MHCISLNLGALHAILHTLGRSRDRGRKRVPRDGPPTCSLQPCVQFLISLIFHTRMTALVTGAPPLAPRIGTCRLAIICLRSRPARIPVSAAVVYVESRGRKGQWCRDSGCLSVLASQRDVLRLTNERMFFTQIGGLRRGQCNLSPRGQLTSHLGTTRVQLPPDDAPRVHRPSQPPRRVAFNFTLHLHTVR